MVVPATNQLTTIHKDPLQQLSYNKPSYLFISQTMTPYRTHHTHSSFIKYNQHIHIRLRTHTFNIHHYLYIGIYAYHSLSIGPIEILTSNLSTSTWRTRMHPCDVLYDICMSLYTLSLLTDKTFLCTHSSYLVEQFRDRKDNEWNPLYMSVHALRTTRYDK